MAFLDAWQSLSRRARWEDGRRPRFRLWSQVQGGAIVSIEAGNGSAKGEGSYYTRGCSGRIIGLSNENMRSSFNFCINIAGI